MGKAEKLAEIYGDEEPGGEAEGGSPRYHLMGYDPRRASGEVTRRRSSRPPPEAPPPESAAVPAPGPRGERE